MIVCQKQVMFEALVELAFPVHWWKELLVSGHLHKGIENKSGKYQEIAKIYLFREVPRRVFT